MYGKLLKTVRVNRFVYDVYTRNIYGDLEIILVPRTEGSIARSGVSCTDYAYTHGGNTYKAAVDKAKEILQELTK